MKSANSLPGPENITRTVLPNGITLLVRSNPNSPSASLSGYFQAGSLIDTEEKLGLALFATSALMRGTQNNNFNQIYDALESVGAALGISAGTHTTGFHGRALVEDLPLVLELLSDAIRRPTFPAPEIEKLRNQLLTGLSLRSQDTGAMAAMTFDKIIFGSHPYARPVDGYPETIAAITREDMVEYQQQYFGPSTMTIAVVGAVEAEHIKELVHKTLGDWQKPFIPLPPLAEVEPMQATVRKHIPLQGKSQTDLMVGALGPKRRDAEYMAASLGNSVLGQFGMMGRIGEIVREHSGLAYSASSSLSAGVGPGTWEVSAGVNPANLEKTIDLILTEINRFIKKGVSKAELQDSQDHYVGRLPLSMESNAGVAGSLINIERHHLGLDYYQRYEEQVRAVTPEMVLEAARKYLNMHALAIVTSGP